MLRQILYSLIISIVYLFFNYDKEKTINEQKNTCYLGSVVFGISFLTLYMLIKPGQQVEMNNNNYDNYSDYSDDIPFPQ